MSSIFGTKDDNAALWLHNKLGSSTHLWSFSSTVASQYTVEKLQSIRDCFATLDSLVKFKFFLSLFHIPKRNFEEFKPIVQEIIENTIQTCIDQWVLSIAMFVQTYWMTQSLDTKIDYDLESFKEAIIDLKRILKECMETESGCERSRFLLPLEFDYLNKEARLNLLPNNTSFSNEFLYSLTASHQDEQSLFKKHFNLFKPSKTIAKLEDLKLKASHYSKSKTTKSLLTTTGLMSTSSFTNDSYSTKIFANTSNLSSFNSNKTTNSSSSFFKRSMLNSTSSTTTITGKSSTAPKRIGGIKLLEVQEQPTTPKEAKRKRKEQEKEMLKKQKILDQQQQTYHKQQTISQLIDQSKESIGSEDDQIDDDQSKIENINVSNNSVDIKNSLFNNSNNNNNMNINTSYDDMKTDIIKTNNDLLLSSTSTTPTSITTTNPQLASITNQTNLINDTNPFQNKSNNINIDQFNQINNNNNTNTNNYFSNSNANTNSSPLLLNQQFQPQHQQQQQQPVQQMDLLYQPLNTNNQSPIQQQQQHQQQQQQQQQSPMFSQMPRLNSVLLQSDINLIRSPQQQQQQSPQNQQQQIELLQSFRTNTLNTNMNNQNILNNNNLINFNKNLQVNSSTPTKLEQFTINSSGTPTTPTTPMVFSNFNPNTSLNSLYTSPLASSNLQQQQNVQHQQPIQQLHHSQPHQNPPQQSLSLTREQMLQAQEMFSNSNKLSRPEKALILGFIAGSRENPRPEHGPLITIKLNESEEMLTSNGQQHRVLSELYFQMNYDTGEYKKIKKLKPLVLNT